MRNKKNSLIIILITIVLVTNLTACSPKNEKEVVFGDAGWDSIQFHNAVAGLILEQVYGYTWREIPGSTAILHEGLLYNEVNVMMELWTDNIATYEDDLKNDRFQEIGINFDDNKQGFYVPKYVIEGDEDRNIEALAPDLKYVWDLLDYPELFQDEEQPDLGRIYGAIPGWEADDILFKKYKHYGLDKKFRYFRPGSEAAMSAAFTSAYEKGEPIVGYNWEPTWLMGLYDFVLLEDEPFDEDLYMNGETEMPSVKITIGVGNEFAKEHKEVTTFLSKYKTSSDLTSEALGHMQDTGDDVHETAKWFLRKHNYLLDEWLTEEGSNTMKTYLNIE